MLKPNPPEEQKMWEVLHRKQSIVQVASKFAWKNIMFFEQKGVKLHDFFASCTFCLHNQMPEKVPQWRRHT
jgi:hypothetical protein